MAEITKISDAALRYRESLLHLGVFILFSNRRGDAWLLEITDSDAVQLVRRGTPLPIPINEDPEKIEIEWTHTFVIRNRRLYLTSYADGRETLLQQVPCKQIRAIIRQTYKAYSSELLQQVHIEDRADHRQA